MATTYTYRTIGDLQIRADVYRSPDDEIRPALLPGNGVQNKLVVMAGFGHGFDAAMDDPEVRSAFNRVMAFLDEQLGSYVLGAEGKPFI